MKDNEKYLKSVLVHAYYDIAYLLAEGLDMNTQEVMDIATHGTEGYVSDVSAVGETLLEIQNILGDQLEEPN
tara:strand:- start:684 stop:899 length:216 start_codon:yes stop_codon:yes gene_type:complete